MRNLIKILFRFRGYIPETSYWKTNTSEFRSGWGRLMGDAFRPRSRYRDRRRNVPYFRQCSSSAPPFYQYAWQVQRWVSPVITKQHLNFDNRTTYRRWSRINTDRFAKLAPKAQISRGPGGMLPPSKFLDFNSLNSPFPGFWIMQTGYWPVPFCSDEVLQIGW